MSKQKSEHCQHCDGKGYVATRDCVGAIQYESTCQMCGGSGKKEDTNQTLSKH